MAQAKCEVYGLGVPGCTSHLLIEAADKFIPLVETSPKHTKINSIEVNDEDENEMEFGKDWSSIQAANYLKKDDDSASENEKEQRRNHKRQNGSNRGDINSKPVAEAEDSQLEQAFEKLAQVLDKVRNDGYKKVPLSRIKSLLADSSGRPFEESSFGFSKFQDFIKAAEGRGLGKLYCNGTTAYILI